MQKIVLVAGDTVVSVKPDPKLSIQIDPGSSTVSLQCRLHPDAAWVPVADAGDLIASKIVTPDGAVYQLKFVSTGAALAFIETQDVS